LLRRFPELPSFSCAVSRSGIVPEQGWPGINLLQNIHTKLHNARLSQKPINTLHNFLDSTIKNLASLAIALPAGAGRESVEHVQRITTPLSTAIPTLHSSFLLIHHNAITMLNHAHSHLSIIFKKPE
jgi:hypothetical protein